MSQKWTHKGWFLFCPVYLAEIESDAPVVGARHWVFDPLFWLAERFAEVSIFLTTAVKPEWEPVFAFRVTGDV